MARILRGDILWAALDPTIGHKQSGIRPVVVLTHEIFNQRSGTVIALAITSQKPKVNFPLCVELTDPKLPKRSWVRISQIRTLSTERLRKKICKATIEELELIVEGLNELVGN